MSSKGSSVREPGTGVAASRCARRGASMSKEKPNEDPRQQTDWKTTKQTDQPWKRPVEKDQQSGSTKEDLQKWNDTNTH